MTRRLIRNFDTKAAARELRRKFQDKEPEHEKRVTWDWPRQMQEVGECVAIMYTSNKWQSNPSHMEDYKHIAEAPQRLHLKKGFLRDYHKKGAFKVVGPSVDLQRPMPEFFAVLAPILGVQARLYRGDNERPILPEGDEGYFQIDIPGATLGAAKHPKTHETFLLIYTRAGVHAIITGDELDVERDGITG